MIDAARITELFERCRPLFVALGDTTRQELLQAMISEEEIAVKELAQRAQVSRPTASHHLKILKDAGLITQRKKGREIYYQPCPSAQFYDVKKLVDYVSEARQSKGELQ